jgi:hypothetical protein
MRRWPSPRMPPGRSQGRSRGAAGTLLLSSRPRWSGCCPSTMTLRRALRGGPRPRLLAGCRPGASTAAVLLAVRGCLLDRIVRPAQPPDRRDVAPAHRLGGRRGIPRRDTTAQLPDAFGQSVQSASSRAPESFGITAGGRYPDPGGDWGLVALLVFKTSAPARVGGRVRFPSASAIWTLSRENALSVSRHLPVPRRGVTENAHDLLTGRSFWANPPAVFAGQLLEVTRPARNAYGSWCSSYSEPSVS